MSPTDDQTHVPATQEQGGKTVPATDLNRQALSELLCEHTCPACGHHVAVTFFNPGPQPLTTLAWPKSSQEAMHMERLPHDFVRCVDCGHISNSKFRYEKVPYSDKPNLMYNRGEIWSQHLDRVRKLLASHLASGACVIEIGCGDGTFLRNLAELRPDCTFHGFDPNAAMTSSEADEHRIELHGCLFQAAVHLAELRPAMLISRHVLEHLMNPLGFVQSLAFAASWERLTTQLFIEVPCVDRVFATRRTVDFFYEHNSHFTTNSLHRMLDRCATEVALVETAYDHEVVYGLARFADGPARQNHLETARQAVEFHAGAQRRQAELQTELDALGRSGKTVAIWGGTGKAAAFLNQYQLDALRFPLVVDSDADKVGTFVPGTGQRIRHREEIRALRPDVILIATQWRAADIVREMQREDLSASSVLLEYDGRLVDFHRDLHPYGRVERDGRVERGTDGGTRDLADRSSEQHQDTQVSISAAHSPLRPLGSGFNLVPHITASNPGSPNANPLCDG